VEVKVLMQKVAFINKKDIFLLLRKIVDISVLSFCKKFEALVFP